MNRMTGRGRIWAGAVVAGVAALSIVMAVTGIGAQSAIDETVRIGFIGGSQTSDNADVALYQAAVLAAEQINEDDGVVAPDDTRYGFEVLYYQADTQSEVVEALENAVDDDVIAVLGPHESTLAQAISDAGTPDVPILIGESSVPQQRYFYPLSADYVSWGEAAADYLNEQRHIETLGMLTANTDDAEAARDAFEMAAGADAIVTDIVVDVDRDEFSAEAETIREEDVEALFVWAQNEQLASLLQALEDARWRGVIVFGGDDGAFLQMTTVGTGDVFTLANWSPSAYDTDSQAFVGAYAARWGTQPTPESAAYYDAVGLIAAAVDNSGVTVSSVASWLSSTGELDGVQGDYDGAQADAVQLLQWTSDSVVDAARYVNGECVNCPSYFVEDTREEDTDETETLQIALITAANGDNEALADAIEDAVRLAIREINEQGGAIDPDNTRHTFSLQVYHASDADEAESALQEAADDGASIVLGPDYNGQVLPNLSAAENASVLQFVSATNGQISTIDSSDTVFQIRATDDALARAAALYLTETRELTRYTTVAVNTDYGLDGIEAFEDIVVEADDGDIVLQLEHDVAENDMSAFADQVVGAQSEVVVVWSTQPAAANLLAALDAQNWDGVFVYGYLTPRFIDQNPVSSVEVVGPVNWWSSASDWATRDFTARYTDRYSSEPAPQSAAYYDTVYLVREAVTESGAAVSDIQSWLLDDVTFSGAQGDYATEDYTQGELTRSVLMIGVTDGVVSELARYNDDTCIAYCE